MSTLRYKDYQASVTFDEGMLVIRVLHIDDFLTTECESAKEAQSAFEDLIEDYLETCREVGKEPCRPFKGSFNVRLSPQLHRRAAMAAAERGQTLNHWISTVIEAHFQREHARKEDAMSVAYSFAQLVVRQPPKAPYSIMRPARGQLVSEVPDVARLFADTPISKNQH